MRGMIMKIATDRLLPAFGLAALLALATPALADDEPPEGAFVREHAAEMLEGSLDGTQMATLQLLAYQSAIAAACEGFVLDPAKFEKAFATLAPAGNAKVTEAQQLYHDRHVAVIYGVLVGGALAEISDDVADSCTEAAKAKADPDFAADTVWQ